MLICRCEFTRYSVYGILTRFQIYYLWQEAHGRCTPPYSCRIPATRGRGIPAESSHERFHRHRDNLRLLAPQYLSIASSPRSANIYSTATSRGSAVQAVVLLLFSKGYLYVRVIAPPSQTQVIARNAELFIFDILAGPTKQTYRILVTSV